jgi:hypothetical protein
MKTGATEKETMVYSGKKSNMVKPPMVGFKDTGEKIPKVPIKPFTLKVRAEFRIPKTPDPTTFHASSALKGLNSVLFGSQSGISIL